MKITRCIYTLIAWIIELFAFHRWFGCWLFKENFYFTSQNLTTHLINDINADRGMPILVVRLIHNKLFALLWGLMQTLLQYWDIRFLGEFIGVIGAVGVGLGIWYFCSRDRKNIILWGAIALGIILSIVNAFFQPHVKYDYILLIFGFLFQAISLYGVWRFLGKGNKKIRYAVVIILFLISLLFITLFPLMYQEFCIKI